MKPTKVLYEKVGRRYMPYAVSDLDYPCKPGWYLINVHGNCTSFYYDVNPDTAAAEAALQEARKAMCEKLIEVTKPIPIARRNTKREQRAFDAYREVMGDSLSTLSQVRNSPDQCAREVIQVAIDALRKEAKK